MQIEEDEVLIQNLVSQADQLVKQNDIVDAKAKLYEAVEIAKKYEDDPQIEYCSFMDEIEKLCYLEIRKDNRAFKETKVNITSCYNKLISLLFSERNLEEIMRVSPSVFKWNPLEIFPYMQMTEAYKSAKQFEDMLEMLKLIYPLIYRAGDLAWYYQVLGFYYADIQKFDIAYALQTASMNYRPSKQAESELQYINKCLGRNSYNMSYEEARSLMNSYQIPMGISQVNLNTLYNIYVKNIKHFLENNTEYKLSGILYQLTYDKRFRQSYLVNNKELNFSFAVGRGWQMLSNEQALEYTNKDNLYIFKTIENTLIQIGYAGDSTNENNDLNIYNKVINDIKLIPNHTNTVLKDGIIPIKIWDGLVKNVRYAIFAIDSGTPNETKIVDMFANVNSKYLCFSSTINGDINLNDPDLFQNQPNLRRLYGILKSLSEKAEN